MSSQALEKEISQRLREGGIAEFRLEARWIAEYLDQNTDIHYETLIQRRLRGEPLAYLIKTKGFYKYEFKVQAGVLVPRPETEFVVEAALNFLKSDESSRNIYDFGVGSGCIGLTVLKEAPQVRLYGWDKSKTCISIAQENAKLLKVDSRAEFFEADVGSFQFSQWPKADLIVSNPPYIAKSDSRVEANVLKYEPAEALFSGDTGLELIFLWSQIAYDQLKPSGGLVMEVGIDQRKSIDEYLKKVGFKRVSWVKDLAGIDRVFVALKGEENG